jgi:sugar O-acyltransferase (sialic acid O-acetyltransferase NeuD family)
MNKLYIIGASNFGREVLQWASDIPENKRDWYIAGFLDSRSHLLDDYECQVKIVGDPYTHDICVNDRFICAVGNSKDKLDYCRIMKNKGAKFINIIHPTAIIASRVTLGEGCIICPGVVISTDATIGNYVILNLYTTVGHDAEIGDGCTLSSHTDVTGRAKLKEGVFTGSHASILPRAIVEEYATVGAGSIVLKKVKANTTVIGVPAKRISG